METKVQRIELTVKIQPFEKLGFEVCCLGDYSGRELWFNDSENYRIDFRSYLVEGEKETDISSMSSFESGDESLIEMLNKWISSDLLYSFIDEDKIKKFDAGEVLDSYEPWFYFDVTVYEGDRETSFFLDNGRVCRRTIYEGGNCVIDQAIYQFMDNPYEHSLKKILDIAKKSLEEKL